VLFEARHHCAVCCNPLPLEQAHIIPWSESHEHSVVNLIALCANCHTRADKETWGVKMLEKYKKNPCILARKNNAPEISAAHMEQLVEMLVQKSFKEIAKHSPELASAVAAYTNEPGRVDLVSIEPANSSRVILRLPKQGAEKLVEGFARKDPLLSAFLEDFELLDIRLLTGNEPAAEEFPPQGAAADRVKELPPRSPGELFIVDNSDTDWKVRSYLSEWCDIARAIDMATGYFEIGAFLCLQGRWQKLESIRLLMGDEVSLRTKRAFESGLRQIGQRLDASIEEEKGKNDFLDSVPAIVAGIQEGKIRCRVYRRDKFHAKAYLTHGKSAVVGSFGLVGSSNFTYPGLNDNVELNVQIRGPEVTILQEWYERHWEQAEDVTADILRTIERHTQERSPFEVWFKALHEFCSGHELTPDEWDREESVVFPRLAKYQQDAYKNLVQIARRYGGAFLCDGVGLGKTYVGLMLIERFVSKEKKNVVLFAPKAARQDVWGPVIEQLLPDLNSGFVSLLVRNHTDLQRKGTWPRDLRRILRDADVVIIDEAHHFRNPGIAGEGDKAPSRYRLLQDALHQPGSRPKQVYFLTATPINNSVHDFRHILGLVTGPNDHYFSEEGHNLGIHSTRGHFVALEKKLLAQQHVDAVEQLDVAVAETALQKETIFEHLVVQRSRSYVKESQRQIESGTILFPTRETPRVAKYDLKATYGRLLDSVEKAFSKTKPLFALAIYYPLGYLRHEEAEASLEKGRQAQVVALIRVQFLKRFESSAHAFEMSCWRLLKKLLAWVEAHTVSAHDRSRLEKWKIRNDQLIGYVREHQPDLWPGETENELPEDFVSAEEIDAVEKVDPAIHNVDHMLDDTYDDLDQLAEFLRLVREVKPERDDKLKALIKLLKTDKTLVDQKVLVFSEFADTARYLERELTTAGVQRLERIDGSSSQKQRSAVIRRFSPFYNLSSPETIEGEEIQTLIATDVLAEGLNLQDASRLINYDLHWNPVRLMQRIGRVDRRMNAAIEEQIVAAHPELKKERGRIIYWNFLPPSELNDLLRIYERVSRKVLTISKTLGLEHGKLLKEDDDFEVTKELNKQFEGQQSETEKLRLEYNRLIKEHPDLAASLDSLPLKLFSGKHHPTKGAQAVFFCFRIPRPDPDLLPTDSGELRWSDSAGFTVWACSDPAGETVTTDSTAIADLVRSLPKTSRHCVLDHAALSALRRKIEKDVTKTHLRALQAPPGVSPVLKCWMELN
jgi:superfamily II DNA or RNA helicase